LADTKIVGDLRGDIGDRQAPATHVANAVNGLRRNARFARNSNGASSNGNGAANGHSNGAARHSNGAANGHSNGSGDLLAELADWIQWNVSPYWSQLLNGNGFPNGHENGGDAGSRPAKKGMALEGITPTGLARRLGR
jgi:hypothetical protein